MFKILIYFIVMAMMSTAIVNPPSDIPLEEDIKNKEIKNSIGFNEFENDFISFIDEDMLEENYMVSPLSFRYAMALVAAGAKGETKEEIVKAMGFTSMDEYISWTSNINGIVEDFDESLAIEKEEYKNSKFSLEQPDRALKLANSIWKNTSQPGKIKESYIKYAKDNFNAVAQDVDRKDLVNTINNWVDKQTEGFIDNIIDEDAADSNTILVNALYMRSSWLSTFYEYNTKEDYFNTITGEKVKKEFMSQQERYRYYEDSDSKLVILPMKGDIHMAIVLGDNSNISEKIEKAAFQETNIKLPKFETETSFNNKELVNYLKKNGVVLGFTDYADFSDMIENAGINIDNIIQKTRIKVDEEGTEAAAVTAVIMDTNSAFISKEPKEFIADKPFTYYIYSSNNNCNELLFYGQIVK